MKNREIMDLVDSTEIDFKEFENIDVSFSELEKKRMFKNLAKSNKRSYIKKAAAVLIVAGVAVGVFGVTMPSYAKNLPVVSSIFKFLGINQGYEKIIDKYGMSKESSGINLTINDVVYDGYKLVASYTIEGDKAFDGKPSLGAIKKEKGGETVGLGALVELGDKKSAPKFDGGYGEFKDKDKKVYSGAVIFTISSDNFYSDKELKEMGVKNVVKVMQEKYIDVARIPDKFNLKLYIDGLNEANSDGNLKKNINGKWNFNFSVECKKAKENIKEISVNKNFSDILPNSKLNKIVVTPISVYLERTDADLKEGWFVDYILLNDKGEKLNSEDIDYEKQAVSAGKLENSLNKTKYIKAIPYVYFQNRQNPGITLNKTGETKVPIGSNKYLTITRLEEKNGKTYIHYKSDDFIDGFLPFFFEDDSENMYMRNMDESVIAPSGKEGFEVYDEPLLNKNLKVINNTEIYYDKEFTIDLK